ncbi:MAG: dynamin family protein [Veillonella sp.]|uniref:dynamin family protein n=1 Tax=Veillonella sp. TaxID=1926307 RepID=UPI0025CDDF7F|nr:dynamin family protein [Veillonella sp.]MBS4912852.1 dynamin family protein [Veillonella sp.]
MIKDIKKIIQSVQEVGYVRKHANFVEDLDVLSGSMDNDFYRVVVLGEFKRGKSTFVNALLGQSILPTDVLPETAVITNLLYADEPRLQVVYKNRTVENRDLSMEAMNEFSARADKDYVQSIDYIKVGYPLGLLKPKICLVDTPGVADLDDSRSDITYAYLPMANAVIFVLDANTPLTKTEKDFIEQHILPLGISDILFIVNKYDFVDEEEDEDFLDDLRRRIEQAFSVNEDNAKLKKFTILPLSALMAVKGQEGNNDRLVQESGILQVREALQSMLETSVVEKRKEIYYKRLLANTLQQVHRSIEKDEQLTQGSLEELEAFNSKLQQLINQKEESQKKIAAYVAQSEESFKHMLRKSLSLFESKLMEQSEDLINDYTNSDFKVFVETKLPKYLKKQVDAWVANYVPNLKVLVNNLEKKVLEGLSRSFNEQIRSNRYATGEFQQIGLQIELEADDLSKLKYKIGAGAATGAVLLMTLTGGGLLPLLSMFGVPFLNDKIMQEKLKEAKAKVIPAVKTEITKMIAALEEDLGNHIARQCKAVQISTEDVYADALLKLKRAIDEQIEGKKGKQSAMQQSMDLLDADKKLITSYMEMLA